ncbi:uncharacterized protein LOC109364992 [Meleagris gallopavo]|uniref:uncharacterized protein LOC109364992 n=1 Tax=Meleagris gallopavo TaxID=9103 RepID=UPI0009391C9C|nr:uncharacterized protein LOC109364992 [Meleagris gallopavo]
MNLTEPMGGEITSEGAGSQCEEAIAGRANGRKDRKITSEKNSTMRRGDLRTAAADIATEATMSRQSGGTEAAPRAVLVLLGAVLSAAGGEVALGADTGSTGSPYWEYWDGLGAVTGSTGMNWDGLGALGGSGSRYWEHWDGLGTVTGRTGSTGMYWDVLGYAGSTGSTGSSYWEHWDVLGYMGMYWDVLGALEAVTGSTGTDWEGLEAVTGMDWNELGWTGSRYWEYWD